MSTTKTTTAINEDVEVAKKNYDDFIKECGGLDIRHITDLETILKIGDISHQSIREKFGGLDFKVEITRKNSKDFSTIRNNITSILSHQYYNDHSFYELFFRNNEKILKCIYDKYVVDEFDRKQRSIPYACKLLEEAGGNKNSIETFRSICAPKIQEEWPQEEEMKFDILFSTRLDAFCRIGHSAGVDTNACFNNSKERSYDKYKIYLCPNTFVMFISHDGEVVGRSWGYFKNNFVYLTNIYTNQKFIQKRDVKDIFKDIFKNISPELINSYEANNIRQPGIGINNIYINGDGLAMSSERINYYDSKLWYFNDKSIVSDVFNHGIMPHKCIVCGKYSINRSGYKIDEAYACASCFEKAKACFVSGAKMSEKTAIALYKGYYVHRQYLNTQYVKKCSLTGVYARSSDLVKLENGMYAIVGEPEKHGYKLDSIKGYYKK